MNITRGVIAVIGLIFLLAAGAVSAQVKPGSLSLSPLVGGHLFEGDQDLEHNLTYGLGLGYSLDENWAVEAMFNYTDTETDTDGDDVDAMLYRLDVLYNFMPSQRLVPYLAAGVGGITMDPDPGERDTDFIADYGGGLKYFLTENIALRGDVRHVLTFAENNLVYTVGLTLAFGGSKSEAAPSPPPPKDSDGDGVIDDLDQCPRTPRGVKVDKVGCPLDSDGDGVPDYLDQCSDTPKGVKVDEKGCPLDTDGDGVPDYRDLCPKTPKGATVDQRGCWVFRGVFFETAKWTIKVEGHRALNEVVDILEKNPSLKVQIEGHTDSRGSVPYNQDLSEKRAKSVRDYLEQKGIAQDRMKCVGYGSSKPAASNDTPEGMTQNRRVEFKPIWE
jgi:OOP family OmpA-OmpF porin